VLPSGIPPLAAAPLLGWAVHTALAATLLPLTGFGRPAVLAVAALPLAALWFCRRRWLPEAVSAPLSPWALPLAALIACAPAVAILPKPTPTGVLLCAPIFDHAKIAIVDAIARRGLPVQNPYFGPAGAPHLAYYYWWHLAAAELAKLTAQPGWTADAALTWFTAFATLLLMAGLAQASSTARDPSLRQALAANAATSFSLSAIAIPLALPASLRPLLTPFTTLLPPASGLGGWLNQAAWAPQHLASAGCLILTALLLATLAETPSLPTLLTLAALIATGFGSSAWVGGVVCALAAPSITLLLAARLPPPRSLTFLLRAAAGAAIAILLVTPLLRDQSAASFARGALPLALAIYPVSPSSPAWLNAASFPMLLILEFPVAALLGGFAVTRIPRRPTPLWQRSLLALAAAALLACFTLRSTIDNNDLGWRAILPTLLVLTPFAAAELRRQFARAPARAAALTLIPVLALSGTIPLLRENLRPVPSPDARSFAAAATLWSQLRPLIPPDARIATDPALDATLTLWPANIGWALLADRASCYAGWATGHPFTALPSGRLYAIDQQFRRIFDGAPTLADLAALPALSCRYALLTPASPAWTHDPFAAEPLIASKPGAWRLYRLGLTARGAFR
jgi:hypothetical protein